MRIRDWISDVCSSDLLGSASTSRFRPLPSRSMPCSAEPKARMFAMRKQFTDSHTALHLKSNTTDDRMGMPSYRNALFAMLTVTAISRRGVLMADGGGQRFG